MASATCENSYISSGGPDADMGESHEEAHKDQHDFMQEGEDSIETLTPNKLSDSSKDLAQAKAEEQGLLSPEEWPAANAKKKKRDRKDSYGDYVVSKASNLVKNKTRQLHNSDTPRKTREKIAQELASIKRSGGMPVDGCLFYLSNTDMYSSMSSDQLKTYRAFEAQTFRDFYRSKLFQALNTGMFRAEIHYDERGTMHLQTQAVWYRKDSMGRVSYAKRATVKENMMKFFNWNETDFDRALQMLCAAHAWTGKPKEGDYKLTWGLHDVYGGFRLSEVDDKDFQDQLDDLSGVKGETTKDGKPKHFKAGGSAKRGRIYELWRLEMMHELAVIAEKNAVKYNVKWKQSDRYMTDGNHRTGPEYVRDQKLAKLRNQVKQSQQQLDDTNDKLTDAKKNLDTTNSSLADVQTALADEQAEFKSVHARLISDKDEQNSVSQELSKLKKRRETARAKTEDVERRLAQVRQQVQQEEQRRCQRKRELDQREKTLNDREKAVNQSSDQLKQRTQKVQRQEKSINDKLQELERRETAVNDRENAVTRREGLMQKLVDQFINFLDVLFPERMKRLRATMQAEAMAAAEKREADAQRFHEQEQQQQQKIMDDALTTQNVHEFLSIEDNKAQFEHESPDYSKTARDLHKKIQDAVLNGETPLEDAKEQNNKKPTDDGNDLEL